MFALAQSPVETPLSLSLSHFSEANQLGKQNKIICNNCAIISPPKSSLGVDVCEYIIIWNANPLRTTGASRACINFIPCESNAANRKILTSTVHRIGFCAHSTYLNSL